MNALVLLALAALGAAAGCAIAYRRWRAERRELLRVRATFARYVAPTVVDQILERKDERLLTGRAVRATVLVCRIRNFAHFIEPLTPEETLRYLNEFYGLAGTAIQRRRGIIESFLGDGIVGVFGVPLENPTQEDDALRAALDIVRLVEAMRERWALQHRKPFTVGIGINSGQVISGDAGFRDRREFTVVGPEAMFAHRLQEAAFELNTFIVAARATCEYVAADYKLVPVRGIPLNGVRRLLDAFIVRGRNAGPERVTLPGDALVETRIDAEPPRSAPPSAPEAPPAREREAPASSSPLTPGPIAAPVPAAPPAMELPVARPRARGAAPPGFGIPEAATPPSWSFSEHDAAPILPEPPPPRATYEDRGGPPLDL